MTNSSQHTTVHLLGRLREVRQQLGMEPATDFEPNTRFAEALDSMGLVEFIAVLAADYGVTARDIENCVGHGFETVEQVAAVIKARRRRTLAADEARRRGFKPTPRATSAS